MIHKNSYTLNKKNIPPSFQLFLAKKSWILLSRNLQTLLILLTLFLAGVRLSAHCNCTLKTVVIISYSIWLETQMFLTVILTPPRNPIILTPSEIGLRGGFMMRIVGCTLYENVMMLYQTVSCATVTSGMCPILGMTEFYWHFASCKNPLLSSCRIYSKVQCVENAV